MLPHRNKKQGKVFSIFLGLTEKSIRNINIVIAVLAGVLLVFTSLYYVIIEKRVRESSHSQLYQVHSALTSSGARSFQTVFSVLNSNLVRLANQNSVKNMDVESAEVAIAEFLSDTNTLGTIGVARIDRDGTVLLDSNPNSQQQNVADRGYFIEARGLKKGQVFVGEAIIARFGIYEGRKILPISTPIYTDEGELDGILVTAVAFDQLSNDYSDLLRYSPGMRLTIMTEDGHLIVSDDDTDKYVFEVLAKSKTESRGEFDSRDNPESTIAFTTFSLEGSDQNYILSIDFPLNGTMTSQNNLLGLHANLMVSIVLIIVLLGIFLIMVIRVVQRDAYIKGFIYGRDHMVQHKQDDSSSGDNK